jgi:hypothetical protein
MGESLVVHLGSIRMGRRESRSARAMVRLGDVSYSSLAFHGGRMADFRAGLWAGSCRTGCHSIPTDG